MILPCPSLNAPSSPFVTLSPTSSGTLSSRTILRTSFPNIVSDVIWVGASKERVKERKVDVESCRGGECAMSRGSSPGCSHACSVGGLDTGGEGSIRTRLDGPATASGGGASGGGDGENGRLFSPWPSCTRRPRPILMYWRGQWGLPD